MQEHDYRAGAVREEQARLAVPEKGWLRGYVTWAEQATDANVAYHLIGGLVVLTQTVPLMYHVPFGSPIYVPLFGLLIGTSTEARKSSAITLATRMVEAAVPERLGAEPGSAEAIVDELDSKNQQVVFITEYAATLAQTERGYGNAIKAKWTHAYDCSPLARVKANKKGVTVKTPRLSIFAGCAPGYVERHTEPVDWSEGFFARHTTIVAERERYLKTPQSDEALFQRLVNYAQGLAAADAYSTENVVGVCAGFTPAAVTLRGEWEERLHRIRAENAHLINVPAIGRAPTMAIKIAALLAWDWGMARQGMEWRIDDEVMLAAIKIVDLHVQSTIALGSWLAPTSQMRDRRRVLALVNGTPIRRGAILRKAQLLKRDAESILATLVDEGSIKVETVVNGEPYYVAIPEDQARGAHLVGGTDVTPGAYDDDPQIVNPDAFD